MSQRYNRAPALLVPLFLLLACEHAPAPIEPGADACELCRMGIADTRFAGQAISSTGKRWKFDSVECLTGFVQSLDPDVELHSVWVSGFDDPDTWLPASEALYLHSPTLTSPMGMGFAAFSSESARENARQRFPGEVLSWDEVRARVARAWPDGSPHRGRHTEEEGPMVMGEPQGGEALQVQVGADAFSSLQEAIDAAPRGAVIRLRSGVIRPPRPLRLERPVTLEGEPGAVLDGADSGQILEITGDSVAVRGMTFRNVGRSFMEDRAAVKVEGALDCRIEDNRFEDTFFGIYLANAGGCQVLRNRLQSHEVRETSSGNGIHLWYSKDVRIEDNEIRGHRDGIYFEFVERAQVVGNRSEENLRYGLHFMFSDSCDYRNNRFSDNGAGVAVMYSRDVTMTGNDFVHNRGNAAFGLLLKDISDARIEHNSFAQNSVGLYAEGVNRLTATGNEFRENGWAIKLMADSEETRFLENDFLANSFDVSTNSRRTQAEFDGNYWDGYRGYDLDRDGFGDVPHYPVRLFSLVVEQNEPTLVLLRSFLVSLLDLAESVVPILTPASLADGAPAMRRRARTGVTRS